MPNNTPAPADLVEVVKDGVRKYLADLGNPKPMHPFVEDGLVEAAIAAFTAHMVSDGLVQADRIAAASMVGFHGRAIGVNTEILEGKRDDHPLVQAFSAHRRAAVSEIEQVTRECHTLAVALYNQHFREDAPQWQPLPDVRGLISQIDNMTTDLRRK